MDYPEIRRKDRALSEREAYSIIEGAEYGVLSLCGDNLPYGVAVSHALQGGTIYFHSAMQGFKVDLINKNPKGYFLFIEHARVLAEKGSVDYRSCGAIGKLRPVMDNQEKNMAFMLLVDKFMGKEYTEEGRRMMTDSASKTAVYAFDIQKVTGKSNH